LRKKRRSPEQEVREIESSLVGSLPLTPEVGELGYI